jgi:hypothetical protein
MRFIFLFALILVALWFLTPRAAPLLSDQAKVMIAGLKTIRSLQGLVQSEPCKGTGPIVALYPPRNSCRFTSADINVAMSWAKATGRILSVRLSKSVATVSPDDVRILPVSPLDLPDLYRILCPDLAPENMAGLSTSPLEKLSQAQWSRWGGDRMMEAKADEKLASRNVMIANFPACRLRLIETNEGPTFISTLSLEN